MRNLQSLTCNPLQSEELVKRGIQTEAFFWHERVFDPVNQQPGVPIWETAQWRTPDKTRLLPAWTKEELDVMIGGDLQIPALQGRDAGKAGDPNTYMIHYPDKGVMYKSGAVASADALLFYLDKEVLTPAKVNERYNKVFPL